MKLFKRLFCKHKYVYDGEAEPITFLDVVLWSQWREKCSTCGKQIVVHSGSSKANK